MELTGEPTERGVRKHVYGSVHCFLWVRSYKLDDCVVVPDRLTANKICIMKYVFQRKETMKITLTDKVGRSLSMRALALSGAWNCLIITCLFHFAKNYYGIKSVKIEIWCSHRG
jgi:hypothetical protein